jgi:prenyltransferase beta subunit
VKSRHSGSRVYLKLTVLIAISFLLIAAVDKEKNDAKFDFKKTSAFTHELETRPDFPVSLILARDYAYSVLALGEKIDPKRKETIVAFMKKVQKPDGGFTIDPGTKETSSQNADFALETLSYLGAIASIDIAKLRSYIASLKRPDGGFSYDAASKESSLATTYYAVHILFYVNALGNIDKAKTAGYIKGFEKKDTGGFAYQGGAGVANVKSTYMALFSLKALGMLDEQTKKSAVKFLASTPYTGKNAKYDVTQTLEEQAYTIMSLKLLNAENKINRSGAVAFIKSFYIPVNGGFGPIRGYGSAPDPTYFGIKGLAELGVLKKPQETQVP